MTDFERKILSEIADLRKLVESLKSDFTINQITYFENLPPAAIVGTDYVAYRFGCSGSAVIRGRFGTERIPRLRNKPIAFIKRDVDAVWQNLNKPIPEKAAKYRHDTQVKEKKNRMITTIEKAEALESDGSNTNYESELTKPNPNQKEMIRYEQ